MRFLSITILLLFLGACGSDTADPENFEPREETTPDRCMGCVDGDACEEGDADDACGSGGESCTACEADETCAGGRCVSPDDCAANCDGCCDPDGACLAGDSDTMCGSDGDLCAECANGLCNNRTCETVECDADTCLGCCDQTGACQTGDLDNACGQGAIACNDCSAVQNICLQGVCMVDADSCAATCAGCCDGETCVEAVTVAQCGGNGSACTMCQGQDQCIAGVCDEPIAATAYDMFIVSAVVAPTKPDGRDWDTLDVVPDVFIVAGAIDAADNVYADSTTAVQSDFNTTWNTTLLIDAPVDAVNNLLQIELWDQDTFSEDDIACIFNPPVDANVLAGNEIESICPDDSRTTVRWRLVPK